MKLAGDGKDFKDAVGEIADMKMAADKAKELAVKIKAALEARHKDLSGMKMDGAKDSDVNCKYNPKDALADVEACLTKLSEKSGIEECKWTPPAKEGGMGDMPMGDGMGDMPAGMDGDMPADMEGGMAFFDEAAFGESSGPELLPKLLVELCAVHPYVGDLVRSQVVAWELGGKSGEEWKEASTIMSAAVEAGEKAEVDVYMAAWLGPEDIEDFNDVNTNKETRALVFPGVVLGYATDEDALSKQKGKEEKKQKLERYLFHVKTNALKACGDKIHAVHRLFAKIASAEKPEGKDYTLVELTLFADHATKTMEEFKTKCAAAVEAAKAIKDKVDDKMADKPAADENMDKPDAPADDAAAGGGDM
jgi:hypothetical protein